MDFRSVFLAPLVVCVLVVPLFGQTQHSSKSKPRMVVVGVNGMEWDVIRPLLLKGELPNLAKVIKNGAYGKLRTISAPNCQRVYSTMFTSTKPEDHGVSGFIVGGITANTKHAERGAHLVGAVQERRKRGYGQRASHFPCHAGEWVHDQRYADSRQKL